MLRIHQVFRAMTGKFKIIFLILIVIIIWKGFQYYTIFTNNSDKTEDFTNMQSEINKLDKIKITVYYEALCSDSRNFIIQQLVPTYDSLHNFIDLDLVPYGKAKTIEADDQILFQCQHASIECLANKIHACSLAKVNDPIKQLNYIACMISDNLIPHEVGEKCSQDMGINYNEISDCANNKEGSLLLKEHGIRTHAVNPPITFIPTVELDGVQKVPLAHILKNLRKELCTLLNTKPKQCL